ncbi:hypothetical protein GCM10009844_43980 [Nocardioides koreensis]|uniref:Uncharacterized protein n=1 Tax=Nocardioides koreensis TaxID=433651 RepID=A0ABN3A9A2_9ACTN
MAAEPTNESGALALPLRSKVTRRAAVAIRDQADQLATVARTVAAHPGGEYA